MTSRSGATGCANVLGGGYSKPIGERLFEADQGWPFLGEGIPRKSGGHPRQQSGSGRAGPASVFLPLIEDPSDRGTVWSFIFIAQDAAVFSENAPLEAASTPTHIVPTSRLGGRERRPSSRSPASRPERACQATSGVGLTASGGSWSDRTPLPLRKLSSGTTAEGASRNSRRNRCRHRSQKANEKRRFDFRGW